MLEQSQPRRVVPRWRSSWIAAQTAEARVQKPSRIRDAKEEIADKQMELQLQPTIPVAAELMFLAEQGGDLEAARGAASLIVSQQTSIGATSLVASAKRVLAGSEALRSPNPEKDFVKEARKILAVDFRNPVLLMDIARDLTNKGYDRGALRYVRAAVALAPQSRFVVRAAARYFLHVGDHEQAHDVLKRSPILGKDPWVQASEIAVATVRGRTSALAKQAIRKLASLDAIGVDRSELATALGTIEMLDGSDKKAKQLFQKALRSPTDNSLAQVEWAATRLNLVVDEAALQTPFSFEANSNNAYRKLMIPDAIEFAKEWSSDEPFASRPLVALTYYYSLEERFEDAVRAADTAIAADGGNDIVMRLNRLFAIIQQGELDGVQQELGRIAVHPQAREHATQVLANAGALAYAAEEIELGRSYYEKAIKSARAKGDAAEEALARANFARTAVRHRDPNAARIVQETSVAVKLLPSPGALHIVRKLVDQVERAKIEAAAAKRVAKRKLEWDATTNTLRLLE